MKRITVAFWIIGVYLVSLFVVPIFSADLYPYSRAPMFRGRRADYVVYTIRMPDGKMLNAAGFGLEQLYNGNPIDVGVGRRPVDSYNVYGAEMPTSDLIRIVRSKLTPSGPNCVLVTVQSHGPQKNGRSFVMHREETFKVTRDD